jgi:Uma2 family endonuclease
MTVVASVPPASVPAAVLSPASPAAPAPAVLYDVDWQMYSRLLRAFEAKRGYRLTYDRGTLEIMPPSWEHEAPAYLLGCFIDIMTEELRLPRRGGGSVTLRRKLKRRGLEPDKCYWLANTPRMLGKTRLDLRIDPPPDLAIEVDVTSSSMDRMGIYAALGVPEIWRLSQRMLTFHELRGETYQPRADSLSFPGLAPADLMGFVSQYDQHDDTSLGLMFRDWVRSKWPTPPSP